jgi:exo-beta-1,3-glucanase (GH17 family)
MGIQEWDQETAQQLERIKDMVVQVFGKDVTNLIRIGNELVDENEMVSSQ